MNTKDVLQGKRILLVEDEYFVAAVAEEILSDYGAVIVGPAASVADALRLIGTLPIDAALLDVNLNGTRSDPVAAVLKERGIPFIVVTGYGLNPHVRSLGAPVLQKPYTKDALEEMLAALLGERTPEARETPGE